MSIDHGRDKPARSVGPMMTKHVCPRCGLESRCLRRRWWDRHPYAATLGAFPVVFFLVGVVLAYPWFFVPLLVVVTGWWVDRRNRRRAAVAARADWEYGQEMLRAVRDDDARRIAELNSEATKAAAMDAPTKRLRGHVMGRWPTTPMQTKPLRRIR